MHIQIVVVEETDGRRQLAEQTFKASDALAAMFVRGYEPDGQREGGPHLREELRGKPSFKNLCGPMWGGLSDSGEPIIRYESWAAYNIIST